MMIKIHLKSDINTKLNFLIEEEYIVYTGDNVSVDVPDNDLTKIKVYKEKSKKMSLWSYF